MLVMRIYFIYFNLKKTFKTEKEFLYFFTQVIWLYLILVQNFVYKNHYCKDHA